MKKSKPVFSILDSFDNKRHLGMGYNALHYAVHYGHIKVVEYLLGRENCPKVS